MVSLSNAIWAIVGAVVTAALVAAAVTVVIAILTRPRGR